VFRFVNPQPALTGLRVLNKGGPDAALGAVQYSHRHDGQARVGSDLLLRVEGAVKVPSDKEPDSADKQNEKSQSGSGHESNLQRQGYHSDCMPCAASWIQNRSAVVPGGIAFTANSPGHMMRYRGGLSFDYHLTPGSTTSRAIALLKLSGAPESVVTQSLVRVAVLDQQRQRASTHP
jgi:hypothetical protein